MIRIYVDHDVETYRWDSGLANYLNLMKQNNIEVVNNINNADLLCFTLDSRTMFDQLPQEKQNKMTSFKGPIVILERVDSAVCWFRDFDRLPNVVAVFKNRIMRPTFLQNAKLYHGRYHYKLVYEACMSELEDKNIREDQKDISKNWVYQHLKNLTMDQLKKIKAVPWDFHSAPLSKRMEPYKNLYNQRKQYDVFCINRPKAGIQGFYRQKASDIVKKLPNTLTQPIDKKDYPNRLASSKIVVCSWGHGEWLHQDGYCMFAGCIIIKQRCDYVKMVPDLYTEQRIVFCEPDFSDLEEKIDYILKHYDEYKPMLESNRKFITEWSREKATVEFCKEIKEVLQFHSS